MKGNMAEYKLRVKINKANGWTSREIFLNGHPAEKASYRPATEQDKKICKQYPIQLVGNRASNYIAGIIPLKCVGGQLYVDGAGDLDGTPVREL